MRSLKDHAPEIGLYGMVNAVFGFVDEQKAITAIDEYY
jgi:hypothetical protein